MTSIYCLKKIDFDGPVYTYCTRNKGHEGDCGRGKFQAEIDKKDWEKVIGSNGSS